MKHFFDGTRPAKPDMTLRGKLGWDYLFRSCAWACVCNEKGQWIVTDASYDLDHALIFDDDASFVSWLKNYVSQRLSANVRDYLAHFSSVPELITDNVAKAMLEAIQEDEKTGGKRLCAKDGNDEEG